MKSQALQTMVKKIFGDEKSRRQFESDPESFLSRFDLTEQEKNAVMNVQGKLGLVTCDSSQLEATLKANDDWFVAVS
jgi:hypothetical protein